MIDKKTNLEEKYSKEVEILRELFGGSVETAGGKGYRFFHQMRVAQYCDKLADKNKLSEDEKNILILSGLFHDIGKAPRIEKDGKLDGSQEADKKHGSHTEKGYVLGLLKEYLKDLHSQEELTEIAETISSQDSEKSKILNDADNLDELGLINIWKMFTFGGIRNVNIEETIEYYFSEDRVRLLKKIDERMNSEFSKEIARDRIKKVDKVMKDLISESRGEDIK